MKDKSINKCIFKTSCINLWDKKTRTSTGQQIHLHGQYISATNLKYEKYTCQQKFTSQNIKSSKLLTLGNFFNGVVP